MDHSLIILLKASARNFLSTSARFEPYVPNSQQNTHYALTLLGSLESVTRESLKQKPIAPPLQAPARSIAVQTETTHSQTSARTLFQDTAILDALGKLRDSRSFIRKKPGIFAPILRPR